MKTRIAGLALVALLVVACSGGGSDATAPEAGAGSGNASSAPASSRGPDLALARERLLVNVNLIVPDAAKIVSFTETERTVDGPSVVVAYEAELEFVTDTYFHAEHKAGDHHKVFGEAEYFDDGGSWRLVAMGIYPR